MFSFYISGKMRLSKNLSLTADSPDVTATCSVRFGTDLTCGRPVMVESVTAVSPFPIERIRPTAMESLNQRMAPWSVNVARAMEMASLVLW
jgi:hypothetical protein